MSPKRIFPLLVLALLLGNPHLSCSEKQCRCVRWASCCNSSVCNGNSRSIASDTGVREHVLNIVGLFPMNGSWNTGNATSVAARMAIEHISRRKDILPGYKLNLTVLDTQCNPGYTMNQLFREMTERQFVLIFGAGCSTVSMPMADTMIYWNIAQLSWGSASPALSDKKRYPLFLRMQDSDGDINLVKLAFMDAFNWTKAAIIEDSSESFTSLTKNLTDEMRRQNKTVLTTELFQDDPTIQVENLKQRNARIIFINAYEREAVKIFCQAYKQGLYGARHVWIISDWYTYGWREKHIGITNCTLEQLEKVMLDSVFEAGGVLDNADVEERGVAGINNREFWELYMQKLGQVPGHGDEMLPGEDHGAQTYDGVWVAALALNDTVTQATEEGRLDLRPENFDYNNRNFSDRFYKNMLRQSFISVSKGLFTFNEKGDIMAPYLFFQDQCDKGHIEKQPVGVYKPSLPKGTRLSFDYGSEIHWLGGSPPRDSVVVRNQYMAVSTGAHLAITCLAGLGAALALAFLCFNIACRNVKVIKMSSPNLNNVILAGCICAYVSVCFASFKDDHEEKVLTSCKLRKYVLLFGFSLAFGGLFSKTFRVYKIFKSVSLNKKPIKDRHLFGMIATLLLFNALICVLWEIIDPMSNVLELASVEADKDYITKVFYEKCYAKHGSTFMGILLGVQGVLLVFGSFIAFETRHVNMENLNDSQSIGVCIYNVLIMSSLGVLLSYILTQQPNILYITTSMLVMFTTTVTQLTLFLPKLAAYRRFRLTPDEGSRIPTHMTSHNTQVVQCSTSRFTTHGMQHTI